MPNADRLRPLVISALLLCAHPTVSLAQAPQAVVDRFYPPQLTTSGPDERHSCFMVLRLTSINEPDAIAAGYTDGMAVVVRLLTRAAPDTYVVSYETTASLRASGTSCNLTGPDLDGDGQPDVQVEVSSGTVSSTWTFKWTGDTLVPRSVPAAGGR
jgi:hypothetical protein